MQPFARKLLVPALAGVALAACGPVGGGPVGNGDGGLGPFQRSLNDTAHGYAVVADPTGAASTARVERFEVRPGDCGETAGFSDCASDRERSELAQVPGSRIRPGTEAWYGWYLYLPADFPNVFPTKTVLGQFHQTRSHPLFMFLHTPEGLVLDNRVARGQPDVLIREAALRERWHSINVHARWSRGDDGFFRVYVGDELRAEHRGATVTANEVYLKYGVYRSFVSRYRTRFGADAVPAQSAYFADVRAGPTRAALQPAQ